MTDKPPAPEPPGGWPDPPLPATAPPAGGGLPERDAAGHFRKGGPGRPKGSRNKLSRAALEAVQELAPAAIEQLQLSLRRCDGWAIRYVLDRVLPEGRAINLDGTTNPIELIEAATSGEISSAEFARLAQGMKSALDSSELRELKHQVEQLELLISGLKR